MNDGVISEYCPGYAVVYAVFMHDYVIISEYCPGYTVVYAVFMHDYVIISEFCPGYVVVYAVFMHDYVIISETCPGYAIIYIRAYECWHRVRILETTVLWFVHRLRFESSEVMCCPSVCTVSM
jgi:hypothetical protein